MNNQLRNDFRRFLETAGYCTPPGRAACALNSARTLAQWRTDELLERVRLVVDEERESYADVYGREEYEQSKKWIEKWGVHWVRSEYLTPSGNWETADSIGMCVYKNPADPFENDYVIGLMASAIGQYHKAWDEVPA